MKFFSSDLFKFIFSYIKKYKYSVCLIIILSGLASVFQSYVYPKLAQFVVIVLEENFKIGKVPEFASIFNLGLFYLGFIIIGSLMQLLKMYVQNIVSINSKREIQYDLTTYSYKHSHNYFKSRLSGTVLTKINKIKDDVWGVIGYIINEFPRQFIGIVGGFVAMATVSLDLTIIVSIIACIAGILSVYFDSKTKKLRLQEREEHTVLSGETLDVFGNIATTRTMGQINTENEVLFQKTLNLKNRQFEIVRKSRMYNTIIMAIWDATYMFVMFYSIYVSTKTMKISDYMLLLMVGSSMRNRFQDFVKGLRDNIKTISEIQPVYEEVMMPHEIKEIKKAKSLKVVKGKIEFKNVYFQHNDNDKHTLTDLNLVIKAGQKVALIGKTGAGKTTISNLLLRSYDPNKGSIIIDGQDIKKVKLNSLYENIAFIPQDVQMFKRSLRENIAYGNPNASDDEIIEASKLANIHEFIMTLPNKYDTIIGERGINLSGGQKQRVAIARAFLRNCKILILDEATSALDMETEKLIKKSMDKIFKGKTVIMITHRLSSAKKMDRIISLENGKITEDGNHSELVKKKGLYYKLLNAEKSKR